MAFPFFNKSSSTPTPAPNRPPEKSAPQKTSAFGHLFSRPSPAQESAKKLPVADKPGFLDQGKFRKHDELVTELKKYNYYKSVPTYDKKFTQKERIGLVKDLERAGGAVGGLTEKRLGIAIKKFEKEKMMASYHKDFKKIKELDQKIKQAKVWKKTW